MKLEKSNRKIMKTPATRKKSTTVTASTETTPKPVRAAAQVKTKPVTASARPTTIESKIDVGFGNTLFIRGQGTGLSWERGVPLKCVDRNTWQWSAPVADKLTFKLLLNDSVWAQGEDIVARPGQRIEITPRF